MNPDISVIIPIFGEIHKERLLATIDSLLLQTGISLEIIISEQTLGNRVSITDRFPSVRHVVSRPDNGVYSLATARNTGIQVAQGEYLYCTDADVILVESDYLYRLHHKIQRKEILIRPAMWRMVKNEVPKFLRIYASKGIQKALSKVVYKENHLASFLDSNIQLRLIESNGKIFSATPEEIETYQTNFSLRGQENMLFQRIVHCGGLFANKKDIESLGCYSSCYVSMYEDSDLQWKAREIFTVREINKEGYCGVLHLDHEMPYRSIKKENKDKMMFEKRKAKGATVAIREDLLYYLK